MAERDNAQERTERATPKRLQEAREQGQIPRSRELATAAVMISAAVGLMFLGEQMMREGSGLFARYLSIDPRGLAHPSQLPVILGVALWDSVRLLIPLLLVLAAAAVLGPAALGGWSFSAKAMAFKPEKLDPIKGLGRIFSARGLMELAKALAKFLVVGGVAAVVLWSMSDELLHLGLQPSATGLAQTGSLYLQAFLYISAGLIVIAMVDVPFQLWDHGKQLRMTRQEVKDEMKETDGRPEVRAKIRSIQREMAQRRMMEAIPTADAVITNPTHVAVALRYDPDQMGAPVVVAKGAELVAAQIRRIARENEVPVVSSPPLARAVFHSTELGDAIPAELYLGVAQILAYVYQFKEAQTKGTSPPAVPSPQVPKEFIDKTEQ
ncbi:MAG: flagellar biosynthesis protein FlhB [Pseudomonadota bacterium]|nr:flagellar biosynthesis protein FlhB [Pseudomonadota bacterium]